MFTHWRAHFEANRTRPLPPIEAPPLDEARRAALARSLAVFQLGETGEGRIAHQVQRAQLPLVDDDYRAAVKLFIAEEGRHSRILALMVKALGGRLLEHSPTHHLFVFARRLVGVRFKLLVLLAAEVIAIGFYGVLSRALPRGSMAAALEQICRDERAHFDFHCDFFSGQPRIFRWLWWPLATAAALTVLLDHRRTLRALGISSAHTARVLLGYVAEAARKMRTPPAHAERSPKGGVEAGRRTPEPATSTARHFAPALTHSSTLHVSASSR